MIYSPGRQLIGEMHPRQSSNTCQELFSTYVQVSTFAERLIEACGTDKVAEIARKIDVDYQAAKNYLKGRLPTADILIKISRSTNVSIHWLLTGEGEPGSDPFDFLDKNVREAIQKLADIYGDGNFEGELAGLVLDGIRARFAGILTIMQEMPQPEDMEAFDALVGVVRSELQARRPAALVSPPAHANNTRR